MLKAIFHGHCKELLYKAPSRRGLPGRPGAGYRAGPATAGCLIKGTLRMTAPQAVAMRRWKLGARATPFVFAFFMASIMAMLMCLVITAANAGVGADYPARVLGAYQLAMPTAFCCVLMVRPVVMRLVAWTVHPPR